MKKVVTLLLALCTFAVAAAQTSLPYIARDKDKSGKYGFVQKGKEIFPHIFEDARSFMSSEALTHVAFGKEYFVIDRKGDMVTNKGYKVYPSVYPRFAIVDRSYEIGIDSEFGIVIDSRGEQLLSGTYAKSVYISLSENERYHLFAVSRNRKDYSSRLSTINGEIVNKNLVGNFDSMQSGAILYVDSSSKHFEGVINAWGKVLVPCEYDDINFYSLHGFYYKDKKVLNKAGVLDKYSEDMQKRVGIIYAKKGKMVTLYDQSGTQLTPAKEYKSTYYRDVFKKHYKKVIIPHFLRKGGIMRTIQEKINNPNKARYDEYMAAVAKLPIYSNSGKSITSHIAYLEANPNVENYSVSECYTKGLSYYDSSKYKEAIPWLLRAAEGKHQPAYRKLADSYNNSNQFQKAYNWYQKCLQDLTPGSNDYWFACMILGGMHKAGRGCEKNYNKSLYYLRLFQQHTTPINKTTAGEMIAEVVALKNKANPPRQQSVASSSNRSQSSSYSHLVPAPDTMPNDVNRYICYKNKSGGLASIRTSLYNNDWKATVYARAGSEGRGSVYGFTRQYTGDKEWVFRGGVAKAYSTDSNIIMYVAFDWSYIKVNGVVFDIPISKQEYDVIIPKVNVSFGNGGGYNNNSGSSNNNDSGRSYIDGPCKYCGGGGGCRSCNGRGYKYNPYSGHDDTCPSCNGSGRCFNCRGTGKQATY